MLPVQERLVALDVHGIPIPEADGFLALYRDEDKLHTYRASNASKSSIDIHSCAGKLIRRINVGDASSEIKILDVVATDVYSGTKAQYVGWDGQRMRNYSSLPWMA